MGLNTHLSPLPNTADLVFIDISNTPITTQWCAQRT